MKWPTKYLTCVVFVNLVLTACIGGCASGDAISRATCFLKDSEGVSGTGVQQYLYVIDTSGATDIELNMVRKCLPVEMAEMLELEKKDARYNMHFNIIVSGQQGLSFLCQRPIKASPANFGKARDFLASIKPSPGGDICQAFRALVMYGVARFAVNKTYFISKGGVEDHVDHGKLAMMSNFEESGVYARAYGNKTVFGMMLLKTLNSSSDCPRAYTANGITDAYSDMEGIRKIMALDAKDTCPWE